MVCIMRIILLRHGLHYHSSIANGVKQGGVISPILFNVYMDDLSTALNSSGIEGYLG